MTEQEEQRWRDLCQQAVCEKDLTKLLKIFLDLNRAAQREQRRKLFGGNSKASLDRGYPN